MHSTYGAPGDSRAPSYGSRSAASVFQPAPGLEAGNIVRGSQGDVVISVLAPWLSFALVSFMYMLLYRWLRDVLTLLVTVTSALCFAFGMTSRKRGSNGRAYILLSCSVAVVCAGFAGSYNYFINATNYWEYADRWQYTNVGPDKPADAVRDASGFVFADDARPSAKLSIGFNRGYHQYCVAPIVSTSGEADVPKINFWAVGKDCCGGEGFTCDATADAAAHSGLVLFNRSYAFHSLVVRDIDMYAVAIDMACAKFSLVCESQPIFLRWVSDLDKARGERFTAAVMTWLEASIAFLPLCLLVGLGLPGMRRWKI